VTFGNELYTISMCGMFVAALAELNRFQLSESFSFAAFSPAATPPHEPSAAG